MVYIYILNKHGKPLMPTTRQSHIRKLIKEDKAFVVNGNPFTVRLKYETPDITQSVYGGMDTGRENIGEGVSLENGKCVFLCETETKNKSIKIKMDDRRMYRRNRRQYDRQRRQRKAIRTNSAIQNGETAVLRHKKECQSIGVSYPGMEEVRASKVIRGQEAQFNNRKRPIGWLTPSGRHLIQMHVLCLEKMLQIMPLTDFTLECVRFNFQRIECEDIDNWQYGPLCGYKSYRDYINDEQNGKCLLCGYDHIYEYHHIVPRSEGGSNNVKNIAGLCDNCHNGTNGVHKDLVAKEQLAEKKEGMRQKYPISLLNSVMPQLIAALKSVCDKHGVAFHTTNGYSTCKTREKYGLNDTHAVDGYAISLNGREVNNICLPNKTHYRRRFKKKSNHNIHQRGQREYYYCDKLVAINRHKAEGQVFDSLNEYIDKYTSTHGVVAAQNHLSKLIAKPAKRIYTFHKNNYIIPIHPGDIVKYEKNNKTNNKCKMMVFVTESVVLQYGYVCHDTTKCKNIKYCKRIQSGCLQYI